MSPKKNRSRNLATLICALLLVLLAVLFRHRIQFDWTNFFAQLRQASLMRILGAIALIYSCNYIRSLRWAIFLRPVKRVKPLSLLGPQFIGFTTIALFGRFADLSRPYIIARKHHLSFASQIAVYTIERMFDLGAAAVIFSTALALTPRTDPHYRVFFRAGEVSLGVTAALALFAIAVYLAGKRVAAAAKKLLGKLSATAGEQAEEKVLAFRHGLSAIESPLDLASTALLSLLNWTMVGEAYVLSMHAFVHTPELAGLSYASAMLIMAVGIGGSVVQLPIVGWFTQIALTAAAMHTFYGAPLEAATAASAVLLIVLWLSIIPMGLVWSQVEHVSLNAAAEVAPPTER